MQAFKTVTGIMAYLPIANIDTDMIIPKQYLKTITRTGLGDYLFAELRYDEDNNLKDDFILNQPHYHNTEILLVEENFGCGSSREHAVWSLIDFGIKVVIAPSFADIFYNNSFKNGLLPIVLAKEHINVLREHTTQLIRVNLKSQCISFDSQVVPFTIDAYRKEGLLKGLDEIAQTLLYENEITTFEAAQKINQPWLFD